jgi:hypothetical protein
MNPNIRADFPALGYRADRPLASFSATIDDLSYWEAAKKRYGIGSVNLSITIQHRLIVTVSADLVHKIIPF